MAKIEVVFTQMPVPPEIGVDFEADWDIKATQVLNWQRINMYGESTQFKTEINAVRDEVNSLTTTVVNREKTATEKAAEAASSASQSLISKNRAQQAYVNTQNLVNGLIIPNDATYNYIEVNDYRRRQAIKNRLQFKF